jgi:hypothetical protein
VLQNRLQFASLVPERKLAMQKGVEQKELVSENPETRATRTTLEIFLTTGIQDFQNSFVKAIFVYNSLLRK